MSDKKFCGNGKAFGNYGQIRMGFRKDDLVFNDKGWANVIIAEKKDKPGEYYAYVDDFKPGAQKQDEAEEKERQSFQRHALN